MDMPNHRQNPESQVNHRHAPFKSKDPSGTYDRNLYEHLRAIPSSSKSHKYENELNALDNSETSGSSTDLSLKSKSQTASTSLGASLDEKSSLGLSSGNETGKLDDGSGSGSDDSSSKGDNKRKATTAGDHKSFNESKSPTPISNLNPPHLKYLPVQKLSTANMKKHDLELAQMNNSPTSESAQFTDIGAAAAAEQGSSNTNTNSSGTKKRRRKRSKRAKLKLPVISSSLDRNFPLPNPKQIELYSQGSDSVHLDPRPYSGKESSTPASTENSSTESSSR